MKTDLRNANVIFPSPRFAPRLHVIGKRDVIRPHVKLPLPESQHAAVDTPTVDAYAHVDVDPRHLTHQPVNMGTSASEAQNVFTSFSTYEMASIMSTPISTQQWAWSARGSGSPDTQ